MVIRNSQRRTALAAAALAAALGNAAHADTRAPLSEVQPITAKAPHVAPLVDLDALHADRPAERPAWWRRALLAVTSASAALAVAWTFAPRATAMVAQGVGATAKAVTNVAAVTGRAAVAGARLAAGQGKLGAAGALGVVGGGLIAYGAAQQVMGGAAALGMMCVLGAGWMAAASVMTRSADTAS